jgi:hypothetical protein
MTPGTKLGSYEILSQIGAGGMGEVYRARDPKLGRDVAIKVLPEMFARDAERMARFQREAKVLASLDHPNIATIHGLEESDGTRALVMEALRILGDVERNWKPDGVASYWIAVGCASLGDKDAAFEWLEKALQERAPFLVYLKETVNLEGLRNDPRFDNLVKRIGIPD